MQFFFMHHTPEKAVITWLAKLGFRISSSLVKRHMRSHPNYPTLLCITDTLDYFGIENMAVQIRKENLYVVSTPFLAHVKTNGGGFVLVANRDNVEKFH